METKIEIIENLITKECEVMKEVLSFSHYHISSNKILNDETIDSLYSLYEIEDIEEDYIYEKEIDGEIYYFPINCEDIVNSIAGIECIGVGSSFNNIIFAKKENSIEMWSIAFDYEFTTAELLEVFKEKSDFDSILKELKILDKYEEDIFASEMYIGNVNRIVNYLTSFIESIEIKEEKLITLSETELEDIINRRVEDKLNILKAEMGIENIENPVIVEKEVVKVVYEEVVVEKEVIVNKCENVHGMYD